MSAYTSGNKAPTLMAQAPNRVGNKSTKPVNSNTGVTAMPHKGGGLSQPTGHQGAPSYSRQTDNTSAGATGGRHQKVAVSRPKEDYCNNDGYRSSSFLK